jgi:hypothetical protein
MAKIKPIMAIKYRTIISTYQFTHCNFCINKTKCKKHNRCDHLVTIYYDYITDQIISCDLLSNKPDKKKIYFDDSDSDNDDSGYGNDDSEDFD